MGKYIKVRGIEIYTKEDLVENPIANIIINHGFAEHLDRYDYVANFFNENNINVFRYDLRGHGRTKSPKGDIDSFSEYILDLDYLVERILYKYPNQDLFMLGHSMGGLITTIYGISHKDKLKGQLFSGPAVLPAEELTKAKKAGLKLLSRVKPDFKIENKLTNEVCSVQEVVDEYMADEMILKSATANFMKSFLIDGTEYVKNHISEYEYPCFISHGEDDNIISKDASVFLYDSISSDNKTLKLYKGLYHEILNEDERDIILGDMVNWIDQNI